MSELEGRVKNIIGYINDQACDLNENESMMVLLMVRELITASIEFDMVNTIRSQKGLDE